MSTLLLSQGSRKCRASSTSLLPRTRTTRLAARRGRLHRPGDPRAGPRDADVTDRATASVEHRSGASRGNQRPDRTHSGRGLARSLPPQRRRRAGYAYATHSAVGPRAGGRLHGPDDAQVEPREVDVGRRAIASVGHLTTGSPRERWRRRRSADDRFDRRSGSVPAIALATSRRRDVWASGRATPGIAIVGLNRRHDRFGRPGAR